MPDPSGAKRFLEPPTFAYAVAWLDAKRGFIESVGIYPEAAPKQKSKKKKLTPVVLLRVADVHYMSACKEVFKQYKEKFPDMQWLLHDRPKFGMYR